MRPPGSVQTACGLKEASKRPPRPHRIPTSLQACKKSSGRPRRGPSKDSIRICRIPVLRNFMNFINFTNFFKVYKVVYQIWSLRRSQALDPSVEWMMVRVSGDVVVERRFPTLGPRDHSCREVDGDPGDSNRVPRGSLSEPPRDPEILHCDSTSENSRFQNLKSSWDLGSGGFEWSPSRVPFGASSGS